MTNYAADLEQLAENRGFQIKKGRDAYELTQTLELIERADRFGADALMDTADYEARVEHTRNAFDKMSSFLPLESLISSQRAVVGEDAGRRVLIVPTTHDTSVSINLVVMLSKPLKLKLHIYPEWLGSRIGKFFFRLQDIRLGHPELDPKVMIKAEDESKAATLLSSHDVQECLLGLYNMKGDAVCNDVSVRISVTEEAGLTRLERCLDLMLGLDSALGSRP